ncbi:MAG: hypothetical protein PHF51_00635 [Candidatus ainarchaeum sp.]|nr:hypothetical protein [Candidatus ainarchaeum sp.]
MAKSVASAYAALKRSEAAQDRLVALSREIIRACAFAVKSIHAKEARGAEAEISRARKLVSEARGVDRGLEHVAMQAYQELCEVEVLVAVIGDREIPSRAELGVPVEAYFAGLMDAVGELRREMLEELKRGDRKAAVARFDAMNAIYEETLPLKFSNSILPGFRKKQDVARIQLDHARSELLRK